MIRIYYESIDSYGKAKCKVFANLEQARKYAQCRVGERPTIGSIHGYAVSDDGIGKITCTGCAIRDLFPGLED